MGADSNNMNNWPLRGCKGGYYKADAIVMSPCGTTAIDMFSSVTAAGTTRGASAASASSPAQASETRAL